LIASVLVSPAGAARDPLKKMSKTLSKSIRKYKDSRVAILSFPYHDGKISSGSSIIPERLTTYMVEMKGVRVVERRLISTLLREKHLSETGVLDQKTAKHIGRVLGVDIIVTGTLIDLSDKETEINARGLLANTGEVISASRGVVKREWKDRPKTIRPPRVKAPPPKEVKQEEEDDLIEIGYPIGRGFGGGRGRRRF